MSDHVISLVPHAQTSLILPSGDIISVTLLGQPLVILGSHKHCVALLDKRSSIYSDRPRLVMGGELIGYSKTLAMMPYGDEFREFRRMSHKVFGTRAQVAKYNGLGEYEAKKWLRRVLNQPDNVAKDIRMYVSCLYYLCWRPLLTVVNVRFAGSIILQLMYGYEVLEEGDPVIPVVDLVTEQFSEATAPGAFLVDVFPLLRYVPSWVPGAGFQKTALELKQSLYEMRDLPYSLMRQQMVCFQCSAALPGRLADKIRTFAERRSRSAEFHLGAFAGGQY